MSTTHMKVDFELGRSLRVASRQCLLFYLKMVKAAEGSHKGGGKLMQDKADILPVARLTLDYNSSVPACLCYIPISYPFLCLCI